MKRTAILLFLAAVCMSLSGQASSSAKDPVGKWKFDAPYAPEGFTTGTVEIKFAEEKYSVTLMFSSNAEYILPCDKVKFEKETLTFNLYLDTEDIAFTLKFDEADKMSGKAVHSGGEVPLTLTREKKTQ